MYRGKSPMYLECPIGTLNINLAYYKEKTMTRLTTLDLPNFHRATGGFDRLFEQMNTQFANSTNGNGYPPYNIA